jgi:hypothetical protein
MIPTTLYDSNESNDRGESHDRDPKTLGANGANGLDANRPSYGTLKMGLCIGTSLIFVLFVALVAANRFPSLERWALERNAISYSVFVLLMLVPVLWYMKDPLRMFLASMIGWVCFVAAYNVAGLVFRNLFEVLRSPFEVLVEGAVVYGVFAVVSWVTEMALHARRHPIAPSRRAASHAVRHIR